MSSGLIALLDDVATLAKIAAASLDDIAAKTAKAGSKAAGIVIDDAAVTPRYVVGLAADREIPIIAKIAWGSLKNKVLFLLPGALLLSFFAPWLITPLLIAGGLFLCYEGAEKVHELIYPKPKPEGGYTALPPDELAALEKAKVASAIRTDMILSAEIMAITLSTVTDSGFWMQATVLGTVGIAVTVIVYGAVAIIVKADDFGLHLSQTGGVLAPLGRAIVAGMPPFLSFLSFVGMLAMLWVGGGILLHALKDYGLKTIPNMIYSWGAAVGGGLQGWVVEASVAAVIGLVLGVIVMGVKRVVKPLIGQAKPA